MVMYSNERGKYHLRTLVERKRKCYENAVDIVVRLHDPTDPSTERTAPPSSAHVQLNDVPRAPIQQSFTGEFRQHDGMVTVMMMLPTQGFSKHHYDMIEVDYDGGRNRTRLNINLCVYGVPPPPYIKEGRRRLAGHKGRAKGGGILLLVGVGFPLS